MKEVNLGPFEFYISEEIFGELYGRTLQDRESRQRDIIGYIGGDLEELVLAAQVPQEVSNRFKILHAHEIGPSNQWLYLDGGQISPVQRWVNTMDGTASVLIIACCNTDNAVLTAKRSSIVYPASAFNLYQALYGEVEFRTSTPLYP